MIPLAIVTCVKNEERYLREWIEFHRIVGVEKFYIYDNGGNNPEFFISEYISQGIIDYFYNSTHPIQKVAFQDSFERLRRDDVRWCAFIDIDEFLFSTYDDDLTDTLAHYDGHPGVGVHWTFFGSNNLENYDDRPVIERFTRSEGKPDRHIKSIVNPNLVEAPGHDAHWFFYKDGQLAVDENFVEIPEHQPWPPNGTNDVLRINHYVTKSKEEALIKNAKGRPDVTFRNPFDEWFPVHDKNDVEDLAIQRFLPELKERLK